MNKLLPYLLLISIYQLTSCYSSRSLIKPVDLSKQQVLEIINKVNKYWQDNHPEHGRAFWDNAAYHTGNMEAYYVTRNEQYKNYSLAWSEKNEWKGAKSNDTSKWKYSYGETDEFVLFGDWQICFQTYIDLYNLQPDNKKIARALEVMQYQMSTAKNDYWWWADGLYMVMPVMTKMYKLTGDQRYLDKLHEWFSYANSIMYDADEKLYYRDAKYVYPKHKSVNGKKDFWARGDGWVFAGLAKVLKDLPKNDPHRQEYVDKFIGMASAIAAHQQPGGYWTRSLLDSAHAPGPETSGTAFFTYGLLWGINNGYLNESKFINTVNKSWKYLNEVALQPDGKIGYVQPIGERAIQGQVVDKNSTTNFGVGAFLLAAAELYRYLSNKETYQLVWSDEFNNSGSPDSTNWGYERGFVRNDEAQWYQPANAQCNKGLLTITVKKESFANPNYINGSRDWRKSRDSVHYTSSCILTRNKKSWQYGRFEMRGKIDIAEGLWPAWWTLGNTRPWPANGEIDIMEYYSGKLLANIACLGKNKTQWYSNTFPIDSMGGKTWSSKFHIWRMDWDEENIALFVDNILLNKVAVDSLVNKDGSGFNPFRQPHYMLLNFAIGGMNGGDPSRTSFPRKMEIDYVRVYQKK